MYHVVNQKWRITGKTFIHGVGVVYLVYTTLIDQPLSLSLFLVCRCGAQSHPVPDRVDTHTWPSLGQLSRSIYTQRSGMTMIPIHWWTHIHVTIRALHGNSFLVTISVCFLFFAWWVYSWDNGRPSSICLDRILLWVWLHEVGGGRLQCHIRPWWGIQYRTGCVTVSPSSHPVPFPHPVNSCTPTHPHTHTHSCTHHTFTMHTHTHTHAMEYQWSVLLACSEGG